MSPDPFTCPHKTKTGKSGLATRDYIMNVPYIG